MGLKGLVGGSDRLLTLSDRGGRGSLQRTGASIDDLGSSGAGDYHAAYNGSSGRARRDCGLQVQGGIRVDAPPGCWIGGRQVLVATLEESAPLKKW